MSLTKTKTKTKTPVSSTVTFPASGWDYEMEYCIDLPNFFEHPRWRVELPPPPGPDETRKELDELMRKQADEDERQRRRPAIEQENDAFDPPQFKRVFMVGAQGAYPNTYLLMQAMVVLGKIVVVSYKNQFMRPRPIQLEPRLRPLIDPPGHPAYPSGHSLQMHLVAKALATVMRSHEAGEQLFNIAWEIAVNREWAGVHYHSDTIFGKWLAFEIFPIVEETYEYTLQKAAREWA